MRDMWNHEPPGYDCPFCRIQRGEYDENNRPEDIVGVTPFAYARVAPKWWPGNPGSLLVIPRGHHENLYELPQAVNHAVWDLVQSTARAVRAAYGCQGTSVRQHNEPAGDQDVWHLHIHVFPRWAEDELYTRHHEATWHAPKERAAYAARLIPVLGLPTRWEDTPG